MKKRALYVVTGIEGGRITVCPVTETAFSNLDNSQLGAGIEVSNPQGLSIQKGSLVYLALSKHLKIISGFFVLFTPVIAAFIGYLSTLYMPNLLNVKPSQELSFVISISFFIISSMIEFILTRNIETVPKPLIIGIKS